jgi:hypothetical protein
MTTGGYHFFIDIRDYCILNLNDKYECNRLTDQTDLHYNPDIFLVPLEIDFTDLNTGEYKLTFEIPGTGRVTISVYQMISKKINISF